MENAKESVLILDELLISKIYLIRQQKVMLDKDLAELYGVKPTRLREQVKRNLARFPSHFMFQLTANEVECMVSQNAIPSIQHLGGSLPYVFTEHGILMLANVLKSDQALKMSIRLIEIFVRIREILLTHKDVLLKIEQLEKQVIDNSGDIRAIFEALKQLLQPLREPRKQIGFNH